MHGTRANLVRVSLNGLTAVRTMSNMPIPKRLENKVALVTASTDGIGLAIARRLAQEGAKVVVSSRKQKNVDDAVKQLEAEGLCVTGVVCHVSNAEQRKNMFAVTCKQFGGLDILVSNAAVNPSVGPVLECDESMWDKIFDVNVKAAYLLGKEALPLLRQRSSGGRIIFISSIAGFQPLGLLGAYSVSKTALLGLGKVAAKDLASDNITVNCVAPGIIETRFSQSLTASKEAREEILRDVPLGRLGIPTDISGIVAFLASDDANYITGETIIAAGGMPSRI